MQLLLPFFFVFLLGKSASKVLEVTDYSFHKQTTHYPAVLLYFYSHRCSVCEKFQMEFEMAQKLLSDDNRIVLARINCNGPGKTTCNDLKITALPTLKLYRNGTYVKDYKYSRTAWSLVKFMRAQVNPPSRELTSIEDFRLFHIEQKDAILVGFFADQSRMSRAFFRVADEFKETLVFAHSHNEQLLRRQRVYDGIVLFRPVRYFNTYEQERVLYTGRPIIGEIKTFIVTQYHGLVGRRTPVNVIDFANPLVLLYYATDLSNGLKEPHYWRVRMFKVAAKFRGLVTFAVSDRDDFEAELESFGVYFDADDRKPVVVGWSLDSKKYKMNEEFSAEALERFVSGLLNGTLTPYVKSRPIPRRNEGAVVVAVGDNFDQVVLNNGKDTLVQFYAPWCLHSQHFAPVFDELGEKLKNEEVVVVKMDASGNDIPPGFLVEGLPTIYWLPKENKGERVLYKGSRSLEDLLKFVAKRSDLKGYDKRGNPRGTRLKDRTEL